ncbi:MAG TPA: TrbI/VirB10 family protein [Acidobacteriota bacterium]|jgi:type IV secretory pathway VirB10-like protein|nr:TrbI/VirB10 family protein [Acidobacteriota bacterium]
MSDASTPNTTVAEDRADPPKKGRHLLLAIAGSLVILFAGVLTLLFALDSGDNGQAPKVTPDQLAQQAFDQRQQAKAQRKADSLADQPFVDRGQPGDSPSSELEKLLEQNRRENETGVDSGDDPSPEEVDRRANRMSLVERILKRQQAEEENPSAAYPNRYVYDTRENGLNERKYEEDRRERAKEQERQPMFVYSRSYKKAIYFDGEDPQEAETSIDKETVMASFRQPADSNPPARPQKELSESREKEKINTVVFGLLPPVKVAEGEFIDTVLAHRIVSDTEESPVVCAVSRDLIDDSGRFVVVPAGARLVGRSQVIHYMGASRLFIRFERLILPGGHSIAFPGSQRALAALDQTGALGAVTDVNRHWLLQFGTAIFVGVLEGLGAAAQQHTDPYSGRAYVIEDTTDNFEKILNTVMQRYTNIVPTITVGQGYRMKVFLTEDILVSPYARVAERSYARR